MASCNSPALIPFEEFRDVPRELEGQVVFSVGGSLLDVEPGTKALPVVIENFDSGFNVSCVKGTPGSDVSVWTSTLYEKAGNYWTGGRWWPNIDESYRFYAVYPSTYPISFASSGSTITATNSNDVCVAYCSSTNFDEVNRLEFEHIFARIEGVTIEFDPEYEPYYTLSDVSVRIVPKSGGTYNLRTKAWSSLITGSEVDLLSDSFDGLFLVPGSYELMATWTVVGDGYEETFTNMTLSPSFEVGKMYDITLGFSGNDPNFKAKWERNSIFNGEFTINADGDKVKFAKGNLRGTLSSTIKTYERFGLTDWCFWDHQWEFSSAQTSSYGNAIVGNVFDHFGFVGESASYDSFGVCTVTSTNNSSYGTAAQEYLKTDWGDIPDVVDVCGSGWFTLNYSQWYYVLNSRESGATVNGTNNSRWTASIINTDGTSVYGFILFPDGVSISAAEASSWGLINEFNGTSDRYGTKCTSSEWLALEEKGCVFLPIAGTRYGANSPENVGNYSYYATKRSYNKDYQYVVSVSWGELSLSQIYRYYGVSVRLAHLVED